MNRLTARTVAFAIVLMLEASGASADVLFGPGDDARRDSGPDSGITYSSVDEARTAVRANATGGLGFSGWTIATDHEAAVIWAFSPEGHYAHPSVVRRKSIRGNSAWIWQTDLLCESEKVACDRLRAELPSLDTRMAPLALADLMKSGLLKDARGLAEEAIADFTRVIAIDPQQEHAYMRRARIYMTKGDYDRAFADYAKVVTIDPGMAEAHNNLCWIRAAVNRDLPLAASDCEAALRLSPANPEFLDSRAFLDLRLGRWDEAIAGYDAALKIDPKLAHSLYGRGVARHRKGDALAGDADIAAARAIDDKIAGEFSRYGLR